MASIVEAPLAPGDCVGDKYRVVSVLGRGGMGVVLGAVHVDLGHAVAIKVLTGPLDETARLRFRREARVVAGLKSPHLRKVFDVGHLPSGAPYMVMDQLEGETLKTRVARGPLVPAEAIDIMLQVCEALAEAHGAGVVHRDLKPGNIFIARELGGPMVKVLDFGIAKVASDQELTGTDDHVGSPRFMAPEQLTRGAIDARTDVWALGLLLYEMLSGRAAFRARNVAELAVLILQEEPEPLHGIDGGLRAVIGRSLAKEASRRFPSVSALAEALAPFAGEGATQRLARIRQLRATPETAPIGPEDETRRGGALSNDTTVGTAPTRLEAEAEPRAASRRWPLVVAGIGAVSLGGLVAYLSWDRAERPPREPVAEAPEPSATPSGASPEPTRPQIPEATATTPTFVVEGLSKLPDAVTDALGRNGGRALRRVYADDSRIAIAAETAAGDVVRYVYRNGVFDHEEPLKRAPSGPAFTPKITGAWLGRIVDDAVARAKDPDIGLVTFEMVALPPPASWTGSAAPRIDVEVSILGEGNRELHYDGDGRFVCALVDGGPACPPLP